MWRILIFLPFFIFAEERKSSFIISIHDRSVKVISPEENSPDLFLIVKNNSLMKFYVKITDGFKTKFMSIEQETHKTLKLWSSSTPINFIPINPPFQELELKVGQRAYEIPPNQEKL